MRHVAAFKTAQHMNDRIDFADMGQKFVAQPSPRAAPRTSPQYRQIQVASE